MAKSGGWSREGVGKVRQSRRSHAAVEEDDDAIGNADGDGDDDDNEDEDDDG